MTTRPIILRPATAADHAQLAELWEASVRATHTFLADADIRALRPAVEHDYLPAVDLTLAHDDRGTLLGFIGLAADRIEMLFIDPAARGQGIGATLLRHAIDAHGATFVDVNEQNPQALGFYRRMGFEPFDRSPLDGQGKPFPLLHLRLQRD